MKSIIICPECGDLAYYNSYFGTYICESCAWADDRPRKQTTSIKTYRPKNAWRQTPKDIILVKGNG